MACVEYTIPRDDDAISVTSDCTLPDAAAAGFGAPLERMGFDYVDKSYGSYASSYDEHCDSDCDEQGLFDDDEPLDDDDPLSPCASSSSSLSDYFRQPRRLSNAGDLAGVEHCETPKALKFSTSFAAALSQGDAPPPRPVSPVDYPAMHNQRRLGTSESHRHQLALARYLNADRIRADPWNHTHPVVHIREHTVANQFAGATLVTERLQDWWSLPFANLADALDYGVAFLHENQITNIAEAVRPHNIQMDVGLAPVAPAPKSSGKSASAPVTPAMDSDDLPGVAWTRADYPVRYYFTALGGLHRVRRIFKGGTGDQVGGSDDSEHVMEEEYEDEEEELARALDDLSREIDDAAWDTSVAVDMVALGNALELVFGKMPFNEVLRPIIQELCDALEVPVSAHDALARVESLERSLSKQELFGPLDA